MTADKLDLLRRLDRYRNWGSLEEKRLCLECGKVITGRKIAVSGGNGAFDPIRANCPTEGCAPVPMDWSRPENIEELAEAARREEDSAAAIRGSAAKVPVSETSGERKALARRVLKGVSRL